MFGTNDLWWIRFPFNNLIWTHTTMIGFLEWFQWNPSPGSQAWNRKSICSFCSMKSLNSFHHFDSVSTWMLRCFEIHQHLYELLQFAGDSRFKLKWFKLYKIFLEASQNPIIFYAFKTFSRKGVSSSAFKSQDAQNSVRWTALTSTTRVVLSEYVGMQVESVFEFELRMNPTVGFQPT